MLGKPIHGIGGEVEIAMNVPNSETRSRIAGWRSLPGKWFADGTQKTRSGKWIWYLIAALVVLFLFFRFLWTPVLPFLLGGVFAMLLQKPLDALDRMTGKRPRLRKLWAVVLVLGCAGVVLTLFVWLITALLRECGTFFGWLGDNIGAITETAGAWTARLEELLSSLPFFLGGEGDNIVSAVLSSADEIFIGMVQKTVSSVTAKIPALLSAVAAALPQILLFLGVFLLAAVYLTIGYRSVGLFLKKTFPRRTAAVLRGLRSSLVSTILLYGRAYAILCLVTFLELYAGFRVLGVDWALGAAVLGALIDLLPVIGTGTLLLPWAIIELLRRNVFRGVGLVVLYIVICVVRQILEPKIIGKSIGLHPLAALFFLYTGMKLCGIAGLFLFPMTAAIGWNYYSRIARNRSGENGDVSPGETTPVSAAETEGGDAEGED